MPNITIEANQMIKKLNPLNKWHALGLTSWHDDFGLIKALNADRAGMGNYYARDKYRLHLWDLYFTMDGPGRRVVESYYGFHEHFYLFIQFVWNHVAPSDEWASSKANANKHQMNHFPYESLWKMYEEQVINKIHSEPQNA